MLRPHEVAQAMASAAVVVVPSRREAFGIVVLEAWRSGAPVIVTAHGGPGSMVRDGVTGLVVDPEDVPALAAALEDVLVRRRDEAERLGKAGERAVQQYTWGRVVDLYLAGYERAPSRSSRT
jgi:glycosyltransferase involved in cell wall biosynthesis